MINKLTELAKNIHTEYSKEAAHTLMDYIVNVIN
jgi:hypothetical protein